MSRGGGGVLMNPESTWRVAEKNGLLRLSSGSHGSDLARHDLLALSPIGGLGYSPKEPGANWRWSAVYYIISYYYILYCFIWFYMIWYCIIDYMFIYLYIYIYSSICFYMCLSKNIQSLESGNEISSSAGSTTNLFLMIRELGVLEHLASSS